MNITDALERFLTQLEADGRSQLTIGQYRRHVQLLATWAKHEGLSGDLRNFDHDVLARFLCSESARLGPNGRPKKASSMNVLRSSIKGLFGYLHRAGDISGDPSRLIRRAQCGAPPPRGLSEADQARLLTTLDKEEGSKAERDRALFTLLLSTGIRISSALALDVEDLDLEGGEIHVRHVKGGREQVVYMGGDVVDRIREFICGRLSGPLFTSGDGQRLSHRQAQRRLGRALSRAGVRHAGPHALRHSFAQALYRRTRDVMLVKRALGHSSLSSTMVYAETSGCDLRQALIGPE